MSNIVSESCNDFQSYLTAIDRVYIRYPGQPWWRGHSKGSWTLVAGVHRPPPQGQVYEANIAIKFSQRAQTRHANCPVPGDMARWLLLAQHYRLRTRLLDWSESPLVALYFAVLGSEEIHEDGVVWVLDPFRLNWQVCGKSVLLQPGHPHALPLFNAAFSSSSPAEDKVLALVTDEVDLRLTLQQSGMTIHGSPMPLESRPDADLFLTKIIIPSARKADFKLGLARLGVRERVLFPDLDHLASDLNADRY